MCGGGGIERDDLYYHLRVKDQWFSALRILARSGDGDAVNMRIGVFGFPRCWMPDITFGCGVNRLVPHTN